MEAGTLSGGSPRTLVERFGDSVSRFNEAPFVVQAGVGIFVLDLVLVVAGRSPDSVLEWLALVAIFAVSVAAVSQLERRPAAIALVVLAQSRRAC